MTLLSSQAERQPLVTVGRESNTSRVLGTWQFIKRFKLHTSGYWNILALVYKINVYELQVALTKSPQQQVTERSLKPVSSTPRPVTFTPESLHSATTVCLLLYCSGRCSS